LKSVIFAFLDLGDLELKSGHTAYSRVSLIHSSTSVNITNFFEIGIFLWTVDVVRTDIRKDIETGSISRLPEISQNIIYSDALESVRDKSRL